MIPHQIFIPSFTMSWFQTVALLLNNFSALLLKANATEVVVDQYLRGKAPVLIFRKLRGSQDQSEHEGMKKNSHSSDTPDRTRAVQARSHTPCRLSYITHIMKSIVKRIIKCMSWNLYRKLLNVLLQNLMSHGRLARWIKWKACDVGEAKEGLENELWRRWSNGSVGEWAMT